MKPKSNDNSSLLNETMIQSHYQQVSTEEADASVDNIILAASQCIRAETRFTEYQAGKEKDTMTSWVSQFLLRFKMPLTAVSCAMLILLLLPMMMDRHFLNSGANDKQSVHSESVQLQDKTKVRTRVYHRRSTEFNITHAAEYRTDAEDWAKYILFLATEGHDELFQSELKQFLVKYSHTPHLDLLKPIMQ